MNVSVYYEDHEIHGLLLPLRINFYFGRGVIQWDKEKVILPAQFPFKKMTADDVFPDVTSVTVMAGDLFPHPTNVNKFGVYLPFIVERMEQYKFSTGASYEYEDIEQLIIQVTDIETVVRTKLTSLYDEEEF
ncbi:hypothetical protein QFZ77_005457 [Paenibacillus sp. V4I3]|uniref:hypothetical protein n=1 Tax=Paenibacillus sp. V4I3 TaxID=3042305 RepID=UPI0027813459|nr:hypothetical protein [Paenibacillus sp. V4I3]MDQ0876798.1 hypothetical protein [Paenibacillus sp. V4I3]